MLALHREALRGISMFAGNFRPAGVAIEGSEQASLSGLISCPKLWRACVIT